MASVAELFNGLQGSAIFSASPPTLVRGETFPIELTWTSSKQFTGVISLSMSDVRAQVVGTRLITGLDMGGTPGQTFTRVLEPRMRGSSPGDPFRLLVTLALDEKGENVGPTTVRVLVKLPVDTPATGLTATFRIAACYSGDPNDSVGTLRKLVAPLVTSSTEAPITGGSPPSDDGDDCCC